MTAPKVILWLTLLGFLAMTGSVIAEHGYLGFFKLMSANSVTRLSMVDLTISLTLVLVWMWQDTGKRISVFAPYAVITVLLGCPGPLLYLIRRNGPIPSGA